MTWILSRNDTQEALQLPGDMRWLDEFDWQALAQTEPEYSLTGAIIIEQSTKSAGRPITLGGAWVWLRRQDLSKLHSWADAPELEMTLQHPDQRRFRVCFARPALTNIAPVFFIAPEENDFYEAPELHFLTL